MQPASLHEEQPHLHVSDGGTRVWLLTVRSCITWLVCLSAKLWPSSCLIKPRNSLRTSGNLALILTTTTISCTLAKLKMLGPGLH